MGQNARRGAREPKYLKSLPLVLLALSVLVVLPLPVLAQSNSRPVFPTSSVVRSIPEILPSARPVGAPVVAIDPERGVLTYSLLGRDAQLFDIVIDSGQLETRESLDYEGQSNYEVTVRATDSSGLYDTVSVSIDVRNVDESGEVVLAWTLLESGAVIDALLVDPDGDLSRVSWQWAVSPDKTTWTDINGAVLASYAPKTTDLSQFLRVRATYSDGHGPGKEAEAVFDSALFPSINNNPPTFPFSESGVRSVDADAPVGDLVGQPVLASDLDRDLLTYWLSGELSQFFDIGLHTGQMETIAPLNNQPEERYFGVVHVFDGRGGSNSITVGIDVGNVRTSAAVGPVPAVWGAASPVISPVVDETSNPGATSWNPGGVEPASTLAGRGIHSEGIYGTYTGTAGAGVERETETSVAGSYLRSAGKLEGGTNTGPDAGGEPEVSLAAVSPSPPLPPTAGISTVSPVLSGNERPGETQGSGWFWLFLLWTVGIILVALLLTGIILMLRRKQNEERELTLPPPTIGPERRIFPYLSFVSPTSGERRVPKAEAD